MDQDERSIVKILLAHSYVITRDHRSKRAISISLLPVKFVPYGADSSKIYDAERAESSFRLIGRRKNSANLPDISPPRDTVRFAHYVAEKHQRRPAS